MPTPDGPGSSNITGRLRAALCAALLLAGCGRQAAPVDPADYGSFFLWAGVKPPPALDHAREVYVLSGEVRAGDNGPAPATPRSGWSCGWSGSTGRTA